MTNYETTGEEHNGFEVIRLTSGPFKGIEFAYAKVEFDEKEEGLLHFEYDVINGSFGDKKKEFEKTIADLLLFLIEAQIAKSTATFYGGS